MPPPDGSPELPSGAPPVPPKDKELPPIPELDHDNTIGHDNGNGTVPNRNSNGLVSIFKPETVSPSVMTPPVPSKLANEADDYLNGGQPHGAFQPPSIKSTSDAPSPAAEISPNGRASSPLGQITALDSGTPESAPATPGPSRRRDVQFSHADTLIDPPFALHERQGSWDNPSRSRQFMSRLKALAVQGGLPTSRTPNGSTHDVSAPLSTTSSPTVPRASRMARSLNENDGEGEGTNDTEAADDSDSADDADADAEETADEAVTDGGNRTKRRRRRIYRHRRKARSALGGATSPGLGAFSTAPNSPMPTNRQMNFLLQRRSTLPDAGEARGGLSEGEGRDHLARNGWRRGSSWVGRSEADGEAREARAGRVTRHVRRSTVFGGGGISDGDAMALTPRRNFFPTDRTMTYGVQKWRQMKNTLKAFRPKKEEFDYLKSAELMAELRAGAPAVLMLASMIQRDEHGNKRIPVLLEQLKLRVIDSTPSPGDDKERHWNFLIDLEYGSGPSRMKWTVKRTIREIVELHLKYKIARNDKYLHTLQAGARPKQPKFPVSAFPYIRGLRGMRFDDEDDAASIHSDAEIAPTHISSSAPAPAPATFPASILDAHLTAGEATADEGTGTDVEGARPFRQRKKSRMGAVLGMSRRSSGLAAMDGGVGGGESAADAAAEQKRKYVEKQRRVVEKYLNEMIHWLIFRADSNRLCRFLELSALGVRLAAEGSYHGKECYMHIQASSGISFKRAIQPIIKPGATIERHSRKWFLVRQSYIAVVESPENMNIYDVFLVDPKFLIISKNKKEKHQVVKGKLVNGQLIDNSAAAEMDISKSKKSIHKHHVTMITAERKVLLWGHNEHLMTQFEESIVDMLKQTPWHRRNRFDSYAPVRTGVFAQWLVDGRDYMWNVSRAIAMAKDVIYIHDWWLSPELYMRRPACISQKWRLDRLLQRKAQEGVKIFVIVYRNVEAAIPIDSEYTKFSLLNLHPNIFVQRSPNQFKKNQFFFAHHEKICIVDHDVAFVGGIDLCFGRWDSPQHTLVDDKPTGFEVDDMGVPKDADHTQLWPGKDYSNPRVQDFFSLREPYKEMYDRTKVPRMPWHDVGMQIVGQPARDLTRHFVQRWNYVRRGRKPTRPTPYLLPPPDYCQEDLESLGLSGTCEVQILRSACYWSLGISDVECSIQNAYISMIEESDHFVYMENQFFITSTETLNVKIVNRIGDALVERIIRAHENDEDWRAVIIIPLMPGFQSSVADQEGTSVRLILQCQYRSICRGEHSIFGRLRAAGIEPEDYIQFFSLRQWGKINNKSVLTTEQLYIHAKVIIVDDRVALIGSANINERSMLGDRDSETAAIVRDRDMIASHMAGRPYMVGRFAHTLRLRLMQEHLGLDTDEIMEDARREAEFEAEMDELYSEAEGSDAGNTGNNQNVANSDSIAPTVNGPSVSVDGPSDAASAESSKNPLPDINRSSSYNHDVDLGEYDSDDISSKGSDKTAAGGLDRRWDVEGLGEDHYSHAKNKGMDKLRDTTVVDGHEVLLATSFEGTRESELFLSIPHHSKRPGTSNTSAPSSPVGVSHDVLPPQPSAKEMPTSPVGVLPPLPVTDDTDIGGPSDRPVNPLAADIHLARITKECMRDPIDPAFYDDVWNRAAENNTKIYRRVFRCLPDSEATNWHEFQEFIAYGARFQESLETRKKTDEVDRSESTNANQQPHDHARHAAGGGAGISVPTPAGFAVVASVGEKASNAVSNLHNAMTQNNGDDNENEKRSGSAGKGSFGRPATKDSYPSETEMGPCMTSEAASKIEMERAAAADNALKRRPQSASGRSCNEVPGGQEVNNSAPPVTSEFNEKPDAKAYNGKGKDRRTTFSEQEKPPRLTEKIAGNSPTEPMSNVPTSTTGATAGTAQGTAQGSFKKRRRATTRGSRRGLQGSTDEVLSKADAEELCNMIQGHIVQFPYDWLLTEEGNGNWLYQVDQVAPLQIYN